MSVRINNITGNYTDQDIVDDIVDLWNRNRSRGYPFSLTGKIDGATKTMVFDTGWAEVGISLTQIRARRFDVINNALDLLELKSKHKYDSRY